MTVRDTANNLYIARDAGPDLAHAWYATPAKLVGGRAVAKSNAAERLIRRAGCTVLAEVA